MSIGKAVIVAVTVALVAAGAVALVSRTPASVRAARDGATDPSFGARFTDGEVARHGAYRGPGYLAVLLTLVVSVVALVVIARGPFATVFEHLPRSWPLRAALGGVLVAGWMWIVLVPLAYVEGFAIRHSWGLSTQSFAGWLSDQGKGLLLSAIFAAIAAVAFYGVVRWQPRAWWLIGWATFSLLNLLLVYLFPIAIAPLFNRFTPVEADLAARVKALAAEAGVNIDQVLVADASRRTTTENAYVAGLGATKRVVLDDTLLAGNDEGETMFVVAHELAHEAEGHVLKGVALSSVGLLAGFLALAWLATRTGMWSWAGASGIGDIRGLPLVMLAALLLGTLLIPASNAVSRSFEADADRIALELTDDPAPAVRAFRRLAFSNLADLRPPRALVYLLFSHPPIPERIGAALLQ